MKLPRLAYAETLNRHVIRVRWLDGPWKGHLDTVDIGELVEPGLGNLRFRLLAPGIDSNDELWRRIHPAREGRVLAWGDTGQFDISAEVIEALAVAQRKARGGRP